MSHKFFELLYHTGYLPQKIKNRQMKKLPITVIAIVSLITTVIAQQKDIPVFVSGTEGHKS